VEEDTAGLAGAFCYEAFHQLLTILFSSDLLTVVILYRRNLDKIKPKKNTMKKLLIAFLFLMAGSGMFAQTPKTTKSTTTKVDKSSKMSTTTTSKAPVKKDGTPDMRYKSNKQSTTVTTGPTKKDGTADMRYKTNKKDSPVRKK
jgi:hypothetical protein